MADSAASSGSIALLQPEAHAASALNHRNICTIHNIGEQDACAFIAMKFLDGMTAAELHCRAACGVKDVIELAIEIADALDACPLLS